MSLNGKLHVATLSRTMIPTLGLVLIIDRNIWK